MRTTSSAPTPTAGVQASFTDLGTPLSDVTFVIVDLETTGGRPAPEGITEIGAVKVRGGEILGEFATLVDPGAPIPPTITALTGITTAMVMTAPRIATVLPSFLEFLGDDAVLVAHNAPFDVGFLKAACSGLGTTWPAPDVVDTVKLARALVPRDEAPNHRLGTLAALFGAATTPNHRALADARATVDVLHALIGRLGSLGITTREDLLAFSPRVPQRRRKKATLADGLPAGPGVYVFKDAQGSPLYVGTSQNIHDRVRTYFTASEKRRRMGEMVDLAQSVQAIPCPTALEAHVREIRLISEYKPPYNRRSKNPERTAWLKITREAFPRLSVVRERTDEAVYVGPFRNVKAANAAKEAIHSVTTVRQCTKRLSPRTKEAPCALYELGRCGAPCAGLIDTAEYAAVIEGLTHDLTQDSHALVVKIKGRLDVLSDQQRFEEARAIRDCLASLLTGLSRFQRSQPFWEMESFVAARPRLGGGWEFIEVKHGKLAGTAACTRGADPRPTIASLRNTSASIQPNPKLHPEETDAILRWIERLGTRVVEASGTWTCPIGGAERERARLAPLLAKAHETADVTDPRGGARRRVA